MSGSAAPADGILAAHCRPNGNSAPPFKRQLWTNYIAPRGDEVTRPNERFGHIVARLECCFARVGHAIKKLRCAVIVLNYGQHVAHAHTPDSRIDGGIESAH